MWDRKIPTWIVVVVVLAIAMVLFVKHETDDSDKRSRDNTRCLVAGRADCP